MSRSHRLFNQQSSFIEEVTVIQKWSFLNGGTIFNIDIDKVSETNTVDKYRIKVLT